ncbi:MAG TPA: hypothetical protein VMZ27_17480, partial [Candidatus Saccharimonadales bacterium]|nr:hypothetical protein [Candidatus Saccharimonadales bacterium]
DDFYSVVEAVGTNGIPFYTDWIGYEPSRLRQIVARMEGKVQQGLHIKWHPNAKYYRAMGSVPALCRLAERADVAIPQLIRYATNFTAKPMIAYTLQTQPKIMFSIVGRMGPRAGPAFTALLNNSDARIRLLAIENCEYFLENKSVVAEIFKVQNDQDPKVREAAASAIQEHNLTIGTADVR